jgi:hypothetical protein
MIGYTEDTLVQVLRKRVETFEDDRPKEERFEDEFIKISDLNKDGIDFVKMLHIPTFSFRYMPAKINVGGYDGKMFILTLENGEEISICESQKLFIGKYSQECCLPILDEKLLSEMTEGECLNRISGSSLRSDSEERKLSIEEYAKSFEDTSKSHFGVRKLIVKDIKETTYKGTLYNLIAPIEYVIQDFSGILKTIIHE